jgi:hypothetical protein
MAGAKSNFLSITSISVLLGKLLVLVITPYKMKLEDISNEILGLGTSVKGNPAIALVATAERLHMATNERIINGSGTESIMRRSLEMRLGLVTKNQTWIRCNARLALCVLILIASSCSPIGEIEWEFKEQERRTSPDGNVDAVLLRGSGGATTSYISKIFLVPAGEKVNSQEDRNEIFVADHTKNLALRWHNAGLLDIEFEEARIMHFRNFWIGSAVRKIVEARLVPTRPESSLRAEDKEY